jgi:hypothetical protein
MYNYEVDKSDNAKIIETESDIRVYTVISLLSMIMSGVLFYMTTINPEVHFISTDEFSWMFCRFYSVVFFICAVFFTIRNVFCHIKLSKLNK